MIRDPNVVLTDDVVIVPIVQTYPADGDAIGVSGQSTVLVQTRHAESDLYEHDAAGGYEVTVEVDSPRADAWERYFPEDCRDRTGDTVTCTVETDRVYVPIDRIAVAVE